VGIHLRAVHPAGGGPDHAANFNYTIVAVVVVLGGATVWWFASASKWFTGPQQNLIEKAAHGEQTLPTE
jgi:hypothetical protein